MGPGPVEQVTLGAWEWLASGKALKVRDPSHETAQSVLSRGIKFERVTATEPDARAEEILEWAGASPESIYAIPGSALEAPETRLILEGAPANGIVVEVVPSVSEIDRMPAADALTRSYVAPEASRAGLAIQRLVSVMGRLRSPEGCPWDRKQTHSSLAVHLLEETYEVMDAIDRADMNELREELGDLLLQVVFHSELARENGDFEISQVIDGLLGKLVERHPHVFGEVEVSGAEEVVVNWERLKDEQKGRGSIQEGIPKTLPALLYAYKIQRRAARLSDEQPISSDEIARMAASASSEGTVEAIGRLLYGVVELARKSGVDPEGALRKHAASISLEAV